MAAPDSLTPGASQHRRSVGTPVRPVEAGRFLVGAGRYTADLRLPGMRHVAFVRSPHAHARVRSIDPSATLALPGVSAVLLGREAVERATPLSSGRHEVGDLSGSWLRACDWPCMAVDRVRYVGEIVAAVVADDRYLAEDAAEGVAVEYEPLPPIVDPEQGSRPGSPRLHEQVPDNVLAHFTFEAGAVDEAFARAALVLRERFRTNRLSPSPLECRAVVAQYDPPRGELTVWISSQAPHLVRTALSDVLSLPAERIRVIAPHVGGGFGAKHPIYPEEIVLSLLALRSGGTVRWVEDRREHLAAGHHARDQVHEVELAADEEGRILGIRDRYLVDVGAYSVYPQTGGLEALQTGRLLPGPYRVPSYRWESRAVLTNKAPGGPYRAVSRPVGNFVLESLLERVARTLGLDPVAVRRRNLVQPGEFPYQAVTGLTYDSGSYVEALDLLERLVDRPRFREQQRRAREAERFLGVGFACFNELAAQGSRAINLGRGHDNFSGYDSAVVSIDTGGYLSVALGVTCQGQSHETVFAQLLADEFGVDPSQVTVREGDTATTPFGMGAFGSRSMVVGGGALLLAARRLRQKVFRLAAHLLEASASDLELADGWVRVRGVPDRGLSLKQVSRVAHFDPTRLPLDMEPGLVELARYDPPPGTWSNGCQAAVVEVDPETGQVRLLRYLAVEDCGRAINPLVVDGQVRGGIVQGIGQALLEEIRYDESGQLLAGSFLDYLLPTASDLPSIELAHLSTPSPITVDGFKGVGESGPINPLAAIANAIVDALWPLSLRLAETPLTPERVRWAIAAALRRRSNPQATRS
ncbi:MAG: xanthine dehydrogenase family protein molybdopterin-binding subunit [Chloroflexi bacterium]|nr:xanthine dehydrogenase family protein molybdopterin-binding subunit [Chloroflexota bacterium]